MKQIILLLLISACSAFGLAQNKDAKSPITQRKIIDAHFHALSLNAFGYPPPANEITGMVPQSITNAQFTEAMLAALKQNNIIRAVTSGSLERVKDFKDADPERIIEGMAVGLGIELPDTSAFTTLIKTGAVKVFGELWLQYEGKTLADSSLEPYLSICERLNIPVAVHEGTGPPGGVYHGMPKLRTSLSNPQLIEEALVKHPTLKVQLMHAGYPFLEETIAILNMYPQVNVDIGVIDWIIPTNAFYDYLKRLIDAGFIKRIMYGSDQMIWEDALQLSIGNIENAPFLNEQQKQDIFYNNAFSFFNLQKK